MTIRRAVTDAGLFAAGWAACLAAEWGAVRWLRQLGERNARAGRKWSEREGRLTPPPPEVVEDAIVWIERGRKP